MHSLIIKSESGRKLASSLCVLLGVGLFTTGAMALPISFDPQSYEGRYEVFLSTGGLTGPQTVELAPGTYALSVIK